MREKVLLRNVEILQASSLRIPKEKRDENLFYYDVRHDDECQGIPCTVETFVFINHLGTLVTKQALPLDSDGCLYLNEEEQDIIYSVL